MQCFFSVGVVHHDPGPSGVSPASLDAGTSSGGGKTDVKIDDSWARIMVKYGNPKEYALILQVLLSTELGFLVFVGLWFVFLSNGCGFYVRHPLPYLAAMPWKSTVHSCLRPHFILCVNYPKSTSIYENPTLFPVTQVSSLKSSLTWCCLFAFPRVTSCEEFRKNFRNGTPKKLFLVLPNYNWG